MMNKHSELVGHLSALFTVFVWGTTFISTKVLLVSFSPLEILFFRFMIGFVMLLIIYPHKLKVSSIKQEGVFLAAGFCGVTLYFLLENIALTYTLASNVGVIISISPFFTALFSRYILKNETLSLNFFLGFIIAIIGILLININGNVVLKLNPIGDFLAVLAAIVWAIYAILTKKISEYGYNTIQTTRRTFFYGIVLMLPLVLIYPFSFDLSRFANPINLLNILFLGIVASAFCFVTWNIAVKLLGAVKTSIYIYMVPAITVITSILVLKEKITWMTILGILFTLTGLFISGKKKRVKS